MLKPLAIAAALLCLLVAVTAHAAQPAASSNQERWARGHFTSEDQGPIAEHFRWAIEYARGTDGEFQMPEDWTTLAWRWGLRLAALLVVILLLAKTFFVVEQQDVAIIERFGRFLRLAQPGLGIKIPFADRVVDAMSLRVCQLGVKAETKTQDDTFVVAHVAVQYAVMPDRVRQAYYTLDDEERQITAYVLDVIRGHIPKTSLDAAFASKGELAQAVTEHLREAMSGYGYSIITALVTDIEPNAKVKESMNEINAQRRFRTAAIEKGEGDKILRVKAAEAEAESKRLQGEGIAQQRAAIVKGLRDSVKEFAAGVGDDVTARDAMQMVLLTQHFDTLRDIGAHGKSNTVFVPHGPAAVGDLTQQLLMALAGGDPAAR